MRISLLLQREPFGKIVEQTLADFWQAQYGQPYQVHWANSQPKLWSVGQPGEQTWLCNIYLNAIFTPQAHPLIFDPIRREFARSVVAWQRPWQRAYVAVGTSRYGRSWLAQATLSVTPTVPDAAYKLIVAGNHKIRILDYRTQLAYSILKDGFSPHFMQQELNARRQAAQLQLPVPPLVDVAPDGSWFSERYISGTPINRLPNPTAARESTINAVQALTCLLAQTAQTESLGDYITCLHRQIWALLETNHLLSARQKHKLLQNTETLVEQISGQWSAVSGCITTAQTHGDFQPANILRNGAEVWLIDWEYSGRRQSGYDALVFALRSRFPAGLATRLTRFVTNGSDWISLFDNWPGVNWRDLNHRQVYANLFLLEELLLHLEENNNSCFYQVGAGLQTIIEELAEYQHL